MSITKPASSASEFNKIIVVKSASQLSGVIDSTKLYLIDGVIDMGSQSITVPEGGISIAGLNGARDISVLQSTADNFDLFVTDTYSGNVVMESLSFDISGSNSRVFNLDNQNNFSALDIVNVNFNNCTSLGQLTDYRQLFFTTTGFINIQDGIELNGTWAGGLTVVDTIVIGFPAATLFKEGTSLLFQGSVRSNINFLNVNSSAILFDFVEANFVLDGSFSLDGVRSSADNAVPNIAGSSVKSRFKDCIGIRDTYVGGVWKLSSETVTTVSATDTLYKIAGTTAYEDLQWFSNTNNNEFVYDSDISVELKITGVFSFIGTNNRQIAVTIRKWDDSASSYVEVSKSGLSTLNGVGRSENLAVVGVASVSSGDRIEFWVENATDTSNVTMLEDSLAIIEER